MIPRSVFAKLSQEHTGHIPFTCSRTVYCALKHCSEMLERSISAQFYCSVLNGVFSEHCSFTLKYDSSFHHLESHGNWLAGALHLELYRTARTCSEEHSTLFRNIPLT